MNMGLQSFNSWLEESGGNRMNVKATSKSITIQKPQEGTTLLSFLMRNNIFPSEGEAKRGCLSGAVRLNGERVADPNLVLDAVNWEMPVTIIKGKYYTYEFIKEDL